MGTRPAPSTRLRGQYAGHPPCPPPADQSAPQWPPAQGSFSSMGSGGSVLLTQQSKSCTALCLLAQVAEHHSLNLHLAQRTTGGTAPLHEGAYAHRVIATSGDGRNTGSGASRRRSCTAWSPSRWRKVRSERNTFGHSFAVTPSAMQKLSKRTSSEGALAPLLRDFRKSTASRKCLSAGGRQASECSQLLKITRAFGRGFFLTMAI